MPCSRPPAAVCVTGLIVEDTAQFFTPWGQGFVLLLIQLGGLGMLTFASLILVALGRRVSLRAEASAIVTAESALHLEGRNMTLDIVRFTFLFETIGAIMLYVLWVPNLGWKAAAWPAIFHAVSAFCNAGFSTFTDSLIGFQQSPASLIVIACLILAGGMGFLTHTEMWYAFVSWKRKRAFRVSLQSRLVIFVTLLLTLAATPLFAMFEWNNCLAGLPIGDKLVNSLFMSITPRTAGFNAIDYGQATDKRQSAHNDADDCWRIARFHCWRVQNDNARNSGIDGLVPTAWFRIHELHRSVNPRRNDISGRWIVCDCDRLRDLRCLLAVRNRSRHVSRLDGTHVRSEQCGQHGGIVNGVNPKTLSRRALGDYSDDVSGTRRFVDASSVADRSTFSRLAIPLCIRRRCDWLVTLSKN